MNFFNSLGSSIKELPSNGAYLEIFTYSLFIESIIHPDPSLIQLSILYNISSKDLPRLKSRLITVLVIQLKYTEKCSVSPFIFSLLSEIFTVI